MLNPLNFLSKFIKSNNQKELDRIQKIVLKVNSLEERISNLSNEQLKSITEDLINKTKNGSSLNDLRPSIL